MRPVLCCVFVSALLASLTPAQGAPETAGPYLAGSRTITVAGITGGNASVGLIVYYPALTAGASTPFNPAAGPCPLVVFGHGFSLTADLYATLYSHWASHGWIVAAPTTESGLFTGNLPRFIADLEAAVGGVRAAAQTNGNPLFGAVTPLVRACAAGHSFGGAGALVAASARPDLFQAVLSMAATSTSPQAVDILGAVGALTVPALHFGASSDTTVPPPQNLDPLYTATPTTRLMVEIAGGTHSYFHEAWGIDRLTETPGSITVAQQQLLVRRYSTAFLDWQTRGGLRWLEPLLGPSAHADARLSRYQNTLVDPVLFAGSPPVGGQLYTVYPTGRAGDGVLFALATAPADLATPYGQLLVDLGSTTLLDPGPTGANGYAVIAAIMPSGAPFQGITFFSQALLYRPGFARLTNRLTTLIP